jgi:hypothetical protein
MKELMSNEINNRDPVRFGQQTDNLYLYDGLTTPFSKDVIVLTEEHMSQIENFVELSASNYTSEPTLVQERFGMPSLVTRVDCAVGEDGDIKFYEMEDSPSGQGITHNLHMAAGVVGFKRAILNHYEDMVNNIPRVIVSSSRNHGTDDALIVGRGRYFGIGQDGWKDDSCTPVIVKAIPGIKSSREPYMHLQSQAVAPLETEGDKTYAERTGLLNPVNSPEDLLNTDGVLNSQVVKARLGSMALGVSIYLSSEDRKRFGKAGTVTASRLTRDLEEYTNTNGALVQEFIPPIQLENDNDYSNAILRIFTLLSKRGDQISAEAIGGCYVARNEVLLHGASNSISGAVLVQ